jgi:hypothetical protein
MLSNSFQEQSSAPRLLRVDQAARILERAARTVRYHTQQGSLRACRGFVYAEDVYKLKERLELYYTKPFIPGSRCRKGEHL